MHTVHNESDNSSDDTWLAVTTLKLDRTSNLATYTWPLNIFSLATNANAWKSLTLPSPFVTYLSPQNPQCATLELSSTLTYLSINTSLIHAAPPSIRFACSVKFVLPLISTLPFSLPMLSFLPNLTTATLCSIICLICPSIVFNVSKMLWLGL